MNTSGLENNMNTILKCRFCQTPLSQTFVDLGVSPVANDYLKEAQFKDEKFYPLHTYVCNSCFLVQLPNVVEREKIFNDKYAYFSSYSDSWLKHAKEYVEMMVKRFNYTKESLIVELASNDGYLLQYFKEKNIPVLGIEPSANTAEAAIKKGIPSIIKFFGVQTAKELASENKYADLILGNNVFAHVPDVNDFVGGMKILLKPTGIITIEFPHLKNLIEHNEFDTIYHEHYSYYSFITAEKIFAHHNLTLFDVEEVPTHGGSLRIYGRHTENTSLPITERVNELRAREINTGYTDLNFYSQFKEKVINTKQKFLDFIKKAKTEGKTIAGYGAPAKGNTLLNYCTVGTESIAYTVDRNIHKQNLFLPGTHIPIFAPDKIKETKPDYVLILPWNLKSEVSEQMSYIREWGGKFVVAIPEVQIF